MTPLMLRQAQHERLVFRVYAIIGLIGESNEEIYIEGRIEGLAR